MNRIKPSANFYIVVSLLAGYIIGFLNSVFIYGTVGLSGVTESVGNVIVSAATVIIPAIIYFSMETDIREFKKQYIKPIKGGELADCTGIMLCAWCGGQLMNTVIAGYLSRLGIETIQQLPAGTDVLTVIGGFVCVCVAAPIFEELLYRGLIWDKLGGGAGAVVFTSLAFAAAHGSITVFAMPFMHGLACGFVMMKYHNIKYPIVMHFCGNFAAWLISMPFFGEAIFIVNIVVLAVGIVTLARYVVAAVKNINTVKMAICEGVAIFKSDILWIVIAIDFIYKNITYHI